MTWECPHDRIVLVEGGYEREWEWDEFDDVLGAPVATDRGLEGFADEGDSTYRLRCKSCLKDMGDPPDDWEWA